MTWPHKLFSGQVSDFELRLLRVYRIVVEREAAMDAVIECLVNNLRALIAAPPSGPCAFLMAVSLNPSRVWH